jgi:hypothetical protein
MAWLAALTLLTALVIPAAAKGPKCADYQSTNAAGNQTSSAAYDGGTGEVLGRFFLASKSCKNVDYTLVILDNEGDTTSLAQATVQGNGTDEFVIITVEGVSTTDGDACGYVVSSRGKQELDRAPADGCVVLLDDGTSPGGGKGF